MINRQYPVSAVPFVKCNSVRPDAQAPYANPNDAQNFVAAGRGRQQQPPPQPPVLELPRPFPFLPFLPRLKGFKGSNAATRAIAPDTAACTWARREGRREGRVRDRRREIYRGEQRGWWSKEREMMRTHTC